MKDTENLSDSSITTAAPPPKRIYGRRYVVHEELGQGAFGIVYRCTDLRGQHHKIALKIASHHDPLSPDLLKKEADILDTLTGYDVENIPRFCDYTGDALVMDHIDGFSLVRLMSSPAVKPSTIAMRSGYMIGPARSIESAVAHDIIHRDVKPDNIRVKEFGYLIDWGFASPTDSTEPSRVGTWDYMAPEVVDRRDAPSPASDVWSLAATTYAILFAKPPRGVLPPGITEGERVKRLRSATIHEPRRVNPKFPKRLSDLLMASLSKYPSFRPEPDEFRFELEACVNETR